MKITPLVFLACCSVLLLSCANKTPQTSPQQAQAVQIGVQLHSIKNDVLNDFEGTLRKLSALGVDGVEFAGHYGPYANDPQGLKKLLEELNLQVSGVHAPIELLQNEKALSSLAFFRTIGARTVIIPHDKRINDKAKIDELIAELNLLNSLVNRYGMKLGYHNHAKEFEALNAQTFWDHLAQNTPENFVLQLDIGGAMFAGQDPTTFIKKYPNRTFTTHFKKRTYQGFPGPVSANTNVIIGEDSLDWRALTNTTLTYGATRWIIVEQEEYPTPLTPFEALARSVKGLKKAIE